MVKAKRKGTRKKAKEEVEQITYEDYLKEREHLSKYEQASYDNYEKTILTLSAAFLAFSVSFLGLFRNKAPSGTILPPLASVNLLVASWVAFAVSILLLLFCFPSNAMAHRVEVTELENLLDGKPVSDNLNKWNVLGYLLYVLSGVSFVLGLVLLLIFCARNVNIF